MTGWWGMLLTVLLAVVVNEFTALCPWLARRLVRWAAHHWSPDPARNAEYTLEWPRVVEDCPGKVLKLVVAAGFACGSVRRSAPRLAARARSVGLSGASWIVVWARELP